MNDITHSDHCLSERTLLEYILKDNRSKSKKNIEKYFNLNLNTHTKKNLDKFLNKLIKEGMITKIKRNFYASIIPINKKIIFIVTKVENKKIFSLPLKYRGKIKYFNLSLNQSNNNLIDVLQLGQKFYGSVNFDFTNKYNVNFIKTIETEKSELILGVLCYRNKKFYIQRNEERKKFIEIIPDNKIKIENGILVKAKLIKQTKNMRAKIVEIIGNIDSVESLNKYIIEKYDLPKKFSEQIEIEAKSFSRIKIKDNRKDLRDIDFITIDPDDAMDHDDAIWASKDVNPSNKKGWLIKIAIADVSFYVKENSLIDKEAFNRCFSLYFPNKVIPMLPFNLSNNLCSLKSDEDRPAIVLNATLNSKGEIINYEFIRALINVSVNLNYQEFNEFMIGKNSFDKGSSLKNTINDLIESYISLKKAKKRRNPLELKSLEPQIITKDNKVHDIIESEHLESHNLVEEFMVTANSCAAKFLIENKIKGLFRVHDKPNEIKINQFKKNLNNLNIKFKSEDCVSTNFFNTIISEYGDKNVSNIINLAALRCQSQANYSYNNIGHFGLSLEAYTHFTSPIRRYSDLLIHRAILNDINIEKGRFSDNKLAIQISELEKNNVIIERNIKDIYSALFLSKKTGEHFNACITSIKKFGVFISLNNYNIEGLVPKRKLDNDFLIYDYTNELFISKKKKKIFKIGDPIKVKLIDTNILVGHASFERIV
ncbi:MAG: hypothetical protein CMM49_05510 [Rhodospirillaceae bacterium]|nr:hypothetical protein [Rhodospirillaceae bacterium]|tara:strand:+ start:132 stop:2261 length:2130 start_codon:yes stop_codon:yes gene_type:complete